MSETLLEFLAIVRGGEREALVSAYRSLNIDDRMRARLSRGSKPGRAAAAEAIAAFPGPETIAALERLVREHCDAEIRIAGVKSLIDLDAPPALRDLLSDMRNRGVGLTKRATHPGSVFLFSCDPTVTWHLSHAWGPWGPWHSQP